MKFQKGNKLARGGKRRDAGRKSKAELKAKELALRVWEKELSKREAKLAKRWVDRALVDNQVLMDLRRTVIPDAPQEVAIHHGRRIRTQGR
ncbi:MAG: hypothetical protein IH857_00700 [Deltaproteobacteria bacterium]|nr:hypothetical protein [Deltaproteobacteria bacterium]